jgi:hypothetical protein
MQNSGVKRLIKKAETEKLAVSRDELYNAASHTVYYQIYVPYAF